MRFVSLSIHRETGSGRAPGEISSHEETDSGRGPLDRSGLKALCLVGRRFLFGFLVAFFTSFTKKLRVPVM